MIERRNQAGDLEFAMEGARCQPNTFGATRYRWIVDRLDIDLEVGEQAVGQSLAQDRVADDDRNDVTRCAKERKPDPGKLALEKRCVSLLECALIATRLQMANAG
jgi:hypothetical protein